MLVDRLHAEVASPDRVAPIRSAPEGADVVLTVLDAGWTVRELLASPGWLLETNVDLTVLVSRHTAIGLAQTEHALNQLTPGPVVVALIGAPRRSRTGLAATPNLRGLSEEGSVVTVPLVPARLVREIGPAPSATALQMAARSLIEPLDHRPAGTHVVHEPDDTTSGPRAATAGVEEL